MKITIQYEDGRRVDAKASDRSPFEMFKLFQRELLLSEWNGRQLFEMFSYVDGVPE